MDPKQTLRDGALPFNHGLEGSSPSALTILTPFKKMTHASIPIPKFWKLKRTKERSDAELSETAPDLTALGLCRNRARLQT